jgi:glycosyltransferase involved in cell wall biosynthesis
MSSAENSLPLVSVAIVTYNQCEFLRECLESVLAQDYARMEIVVGDDCSTDNTAEMLRGYAQKYPGLFVLALAKVNQGVTKNANSAFRLCTGEYIAWLGGDDLMLPGKIAAQVGYMESCPKCSISFHNVEVFESDSGRTIRLFNDAKTTRVGSLKTIFREKTYNCGCATMIRARDCPSGGFDEGLPIASDWKLWLEILSKGGEMHYIPRVLGRYRRHASNVTTRGGPNFKRAQADHLNTIRWMMVEYPQYGREATIALAETLRQMRWISAENYLCYLKLSIRIRVSVRATISLVVYYATLRQVAL